MTLPPDIPAARFWSLTLYDTETRSMLHTPQRFPRAGSQSYPTPAATPEDGRLDDRHVQSGTALGGARTATGSRPGEGKSFFVVCACTARSQPFFDKTWRPSEIEPVG